MTNDILPHKCPYAPQLKKDAVYVWCISLEMDTSYLEFFYHLLSEEERMRAGRMRFQKIRNRYVASRGGLRWIIAGFLDMKPEKLEFSYGPHGKPELLGQSGSPALTFNMSHSQDLALYGVGLGRTVGVDIEKVREDMSLLKIAKRFFSPPEYNALKSLPPEHVKHGFYNCWTRKEAYIKAKGESLSSAISRFSVSLIPGEPAALLQYPPDPLEPTRWSFRDLQVAPGYKAAVVIEGSQVSVTRVGEKTIIF